uniref:Hexosyltransferase n=1 Tax=Fagus sylvatica TaxID=28930 RepID=A0A2N9FIT9_FAGSY
MSMKSRGMGGREYAKNVKKSKNLALLLCLGSFCFCAGMIFTNRMWTVPEAKGIAITSKLEDAQINLSSDNYPKLKVVQRNSNASMGELDKTVTKLEMKVTDDRAAHESIMHSFPMSRNMKNVETNPKRKYFMVIGINTAFSSRKRRESVRATWMPQGEKRKKLEEEKGIVIRFVIGRSSTSGGILDKAIEAEEKLHGDFLRLDHVEGYLELSGKTKTYFSTAVALWDAEFYVKVDDDIHVNIAMLGTTLARHRMKPQVYIGCMKSGLVHARKGMKYHEPEYWKFGEMDRMDWNQEVLVPLLCPLPSLRRHILHKYANEDVSLGTWLIGLDVEHVDDRRLCCGTPPDCERKAQAGNVCAASFDRKCNGICKSVEKIMDVHQRCGEDENAIWSASF